MMTIRRKKVDAANVANESRYERMGTYPGRSDGSPAMTECSDKMLAMCRMPNGKDMINVSSRNKVPAQRPMMSAWPY